MGRQVKVNKGNIPELKWFFSDEETQGENMSMCVTEEWNKRSPEGLGSKVPEESPAWKLMFYLHPILEINNWW